jgi:hypothetical protein
MSGQKYCINPVSRGLNNFFENISNSTNPQYIQPTSTPQYVPPPQPTYTPPPPIPVTPLPPSKIYPLPTVTYTPVSARAYFEPLNSNYTNAHLGK